MAPLDFLPEESLNRKEQRAFSELADTLIFETPQNFKLSRKSIPALSRHVQDTFALQDAAHHEADQRHKNEQVRRAIEGMRLNVAANAGEAKSPPEEKEEEKEEPRQEKREDNRSFTEKVLGRVGLYIAEHGSEYWQSQGYGAWGFTPKLAGMRTREYKQPYEKDGKNCFGVVQGLGALFSDMDVPCEMGITADHPFAVVEIEGKNYLASLFGMHEAKGTFEMHEGYKTYMPSPEDGIPYKLMTVWNFDDALVYELLENFEVLRQMSLGNKVQNLPGTEESGMKLAEQNRGTLQAVSWRTIQEKVTPRLAKYFHNNERAWAAEAERIGIRREINFYFKQAMEAGQAATSLKDATFEDFKKKFLPVAQEYDLSIKNLIVAGVECGPDVPGDVVLFAHKVKEILDAIPIPEIRLEVRGALLRPFTTEDDD